jgi:hypothetical protein
MSLHPPFRAEHIGSLVRPPELLRARARHAAGELDREELAAIEDEAMRGAIELQEGVGLEVITDGNLSRRAADHRSGAADTQSLEPQISDLRDEADAGLRGGSNIPALVAKPSHDGWVFAQFNQRMYRNGMRSDEPVS